MIDQYKISLIILIVTFLINLITYSGYERQVSPVKFLKMFFVRSEDQAENIRLYIFQISFWMLIPLLILVRAASQ
jgi:hypothetical protein